MSNQEFFKDQYRISFLVKLPETHQETQTLGHGASCSLNMQGIK